MQAIENNKPFIKLFKTPRQFYLYSVNRNTVVNISEETYRFLDGDSDVPFSDDTENELDQLRMDGYLSAKRMQTVRHPFLDNLEESLKTRMSQIVLQVTQSCNLVCEYCPFANQEGVEYRKHSQKKMSLETAKKAIDFYAAHAGEADTLTVSFYGGEPLLAFDLIKDVVAYTNARYFGKNIFYNLTTNGTLLTDEMICFFIQNEFSIMFSIDGPAKIHDQHRKHVDGTGSFEAAKSNLFRLYDRYASQGIKGKLSINMVLDPKNDPDEILMLFDDSFFNDKIIVQGSIVEEVVKDKEMEVSPRYSEKMQYLNFLANADRFKIIDGLHICKLLKKSYLTSDQKYDTLKYGINGLPDVGAPGGPCLPGQRRLFVNVDGDFFPCEKVSEIANAMKIGDIDNGFDLHKIEGVLDVANLTPEKCRNCWAVLHCVLCAKNCCHDGELSGKQRLRNCREQQSNTAQTIQDFILQQECKTIYKR